MLKFLLLRLKHATLAELSCRVRQRARAASIRAAASRRRGCYAPPGNPLELSGLALPAFRPEVPAARVEAVISGELFTLNAGSRTLERWSSELSGTGRRRCGDADLRTVWEPARLQHLTLLFAYLSRVPKGSCADRAREFASRELSRFLDDNPFPKGPHYLSAMECALRLPVFFYALKLLPGLPPADSARLAGAAHDHARWIEANLSLHSSLGNHTVCEAAGLVFAGGMFRGSERGRKWLELGCGLLESELARQVLPDGGPLEQSLAYHRFVLDVYWLAVSFLEGSGLRDCADWRRRLRRGEEFLVAFALPGGNYPAIGDSDDGCAVAPGLAPQRERGFPGEAPCRVFPDAGYTVIEAAGEARIVFDHAPLGMAPLYNHGHADALSVTLSLSGTELLVDPGTYRYNGAPSWRRYFRGTAAHNTVTVDGLDQAVQQTGFIWSDPYACRLLRREESHCILVQAEHDGYLRLGEPVLHRRTVAVIGERAVLTDSFQGSGDHEFALHFHLHPSALVTRSGERWCVSRGDECATLYLAGEGDFELVSGGAGGEFGWYSAAYGSKVPSLALRCSRKGSCEAVSFTTLIAWGRAAGRMQHEEGR